jgi:hypothetical protein
MAHVRTLNGFGKVESELTEEIDVRFHRWSFLLSSCRNEFVIEDEMLYSAKIHSRRN